MSTVIQLNNKWWEPSSLNIIIKHRYFRLSLFARIVSIIKDKKGESSNLAYALSSSSPIIFMASGLWCVQIDKHTRYFISILKNTVHSLNVIYLFWWRLYFTRRRKWIGSVSISEYTFENTGNLDFLNLCKKQEATERHHDSSVIKSHHNIC